MTTNFPFLVRFIVKDRSNLGTSVYRKPINTGLLLHYQNHVDNRYKRALLKTMLNQVFFLSSSWIALSEEYYRLRDIF